MLRRLDSWSILEGMMEHTTQPCSVVICSFAIAEDWIKRLYRLKKKGKLEKITVVLDNVIMTRHRQKVIMLENIVDEIYLNDTHAKMIVIENKVFQAAALISANATMNSRIESAYVTNRTDEIVTIKQELKQIYDNSRAIKPGL